MIGGQDHVRTDEKARRIPAYPLMARLRFDTTDGPRKQFEPCDPFWNILKANVLEQKPLSVLKRCLAVLWREESGDDRDIALDEYRDLTQLRVVGRRFDRRLQ